MSRWTLAWGTFLSYRRIAHLGCCFADTAVNIGGGCALHVISDVGVNVHRSGRRHMVQHGGKGFHIHAVRQRQGCKGMPIGYNKDKSGILVFSRGCGFVLVLFPLKNPPKMGVGEGVIKGHFT